MNGYKTWISLVAGVILLGGASPALANLTADLEAVDRIDTEASVTVGYRGVGTDDNPGRAREYDSLEPSPTFKAKLFTDKGAYHLDFSADYLNEDDYAAEAHFDYGGLVRLDLRSQRMFHNLDHIPYANGFSGDPYVGDHDNNIITPDTLGRDPGPAAAGSRPDATFNGAYRAYYTDQDPGDDYGRRLDMNEVKLKVKCPDYPAHVTLSYWRYEKEGEKQLRFAGENCTTACHMQSKSRDINRVTEEVKAGVDAHAGFIDIVLEGLVRTFRDHEPVPVDAFGSHSRGRAIGDYEHDEDPDSKVKELSLRLNTAPSGGFVASGAFTLGERENQSDLTSVGPVHAETDYYRASADATYTPSETWTFNLRYRLLDMDSANTDVFTDYDSTNPNPLDVRDAMDITRAWYEAIASYRPSKQLTLRAEFRREEIDRSNTGPAIDHVSSATKPVVINPNWELPDEEVITRVKLGFSSRLLEKSALKLSGWLAIQQDDDPAYGTTAEESQELFLTASYTPSPLWGMTTNLNVLKQENSDHVLHDYDIERKKQQQNFAFGTWVNPREGLSFDLNYGYFHTVIDQDLLFGTSTHTYTTGDPPVVDEIVDYRIPDYNDDYRQTVHTVTAGVTLQAMKNLSCRLEGYHTRSKADFSPDFNRTDIRYRSGDGDATSADLDDITRLEVRQNGVRGRVNWQIDENWSCGVEASYDNYDELGNDVFDGSVETAMISVSRNW